VVSKSLSSEKFLNEIKELQDKIKEIKVLDIEVLQVKKIWKEK